VSRFSPVSTTSVTIELIPASLADSSLADYEVPGRTLTQHPITNALTEGFNSKIQVIKADTRGFRRFANNRTRIRFLCGKLDRTPQLPNDATHTIP
jgi:hypothetical protein